MRSMYACIAALVVVLPLSADRALADASESQMATVSSVRDAGTLIMSWLGAQLPKDTDQPPTPDSFVWSSCTPTTYEHLQSLLGESATTLPRQDGWGNDLQFCLSIDPKATPSSRFVAGIRSPGRDGKFQDSEYQHAPFDFSESDQDVVWLNGFFFAWPQKK